MIRKLNTPTAILLVACLTLAPTALAADGSGGSWFSDLIEVVTEWVVGGDDVADENETQSGDTTEQKSSSQELCEPSQEMGPSVEPQGPGC